MTSSERQREPHLRLSVFRCFAFALLVTRVSAAEPGVVRVSVLASDGGTWLDPARDHLAISREMPTAFDPAQPPPVEPEAFRLVFSGLGALASERALPHMRTVMPILFVAVAALLILYGLFLGRALDAIGAFPYGVRLLLSFAIIAPPAFLMGFPMPTAMTTLGRLGKEHLFIWAWGVNGCFSVIGAAAAPVIATNFGLGAVIEIAGCAYLLALPAFFAVISGDRPRRLA